MNKDQKLLEEAYQSIYEGAAREPAYFGPPDEKKDYMKWLKRLDYEVHEDGSVSVRQNIILHDWGLTRIPFNFKKVGGYFDCASNQLTTLKGAPEIVGGDFICSDNKLTSLEGAPEVIGGEFDSDQFSDEDYRTFAKKRKYVDGKLDIELDTDLEDFS